MGGAIVPSQKGPAVQVCDLRSLRDVVHLQLGKHLPKHVNIIMSGLEGLALAASVGAVLEMADRAYRVVFQYLPAVKSARKDAERLISEVRFVISFLFLT